MPVTNKRLAPQPITIKNSNGTSMTATHIADLQIDALPPEARIGYIVPDIDVCLLAVAPLCDAGCEVRFTATAVIIEQNGKQILQGERDTKNSLWHIPYKVTPQQAFSMQLTPTQLVEFAHAEIFSPRITTLQKALDSNFLPPIPGLTVALLCRHPPNLIATAKGHMDQTRKNLRSTKATTPSPDTTDDTDDIDVEHISDQTHFCYAATVEVTGQVFLDQTGKFISPSSSRNN